MVEFAEQVEQTVVDVLAELKPGRELYANVEFYAGVVMDRCGLPRDMFTPDVRVEPGDRLVRQHPRAGRRQPDHPPQRPLRRPAAAPARPRPSAGPLATAAACGRVTVTVTEATVVDDELVDAFVRLMPQLSSLQPAPVPGGAGRDRGLAGHRPVRRPGG